MWNMENRTNICILERIVQKIRGFAGMVILCAFMILLCILFVTIWVVWLIADFIIRKLEKGGNL